MTPEHVGPNSIIARVREFPTRLDIGIHKRIVHRTSLDIINILLQLPPNPRQLIHRFETTLPDGKHLIADLYNESRAPTLRKFIESRSERHRLEVRIVWPTRLNNIDIDYRPNTGRQFPVNGLFFYAHDDPSGNVIFSARQAHGVMNGYRVEVANEQLLPFTDPVEQRVYRETAHYLGIARNSMTPLLSRYQSE